MLIADNHKLVTDACKQMLEPQFDVVGAVSDGRALVEAALRLKPDVLVLEIVLPQLNGIDAAEQVKRSLSSVKIVFLTAVSDVEAAAEAFRRGASAYVLKQSGADEFVTAVRNVMRGESYLSPLIARETMQYLLHPPKRGTVGQRLTMREVEVLQLLTEGRSMKEVGAVLDIASNTVAFHKYRMMDKLGIKTSAGLVQYAMNHNMAPRQESWTITDSTGPRLLEAG